MKHWYRTMNRPERDALLRYIERWRVPQTASSHRWPVVLPPDTGELPLVGVIIAESFRAAA